MESSESFAARAVEPDYCPWSNGGFSGNNQILEGLLKCYNQIRAAAGTDQNCPDVSATDVACDQSSSPTQTPRIDAAKVMFSQSLATLLKKLRNVRDHCDALFYSKLRLL